jgi:hypothetical protein
MNLDLNGLTSVRHVQAALGRSGQLVPMAWSRPDNPGAASLFDQGPGLLVSMTRLDTLSPLLAGRPFRLLLLDVQGYEQEALAGCDLANGPDVIIVELSRDYMNQAGVPAENIAAMLASSGYDLSDVHGGSPAELFDLPESNMVAVKRGATVRWNARDQQTPRETWRSEPLTGRKA